MAKYHPDWQIDILAKIGKHSAFNGLCRRAYHDKEQPPSGHYDQRYKLDWWECSAVYSDSPSTKAAKCLREVFHIQPDPALMRYKVNVGKEARDLADEYLRSIGCEKRNGRYNAVPIHYQGNTSQNQKNLNHGDVAAVCRTILALGYVPVILDWDNRSSLYDQRTIFCPTVHADLWGKIGTGCAERITALISLCSAMLGIDSGPQKAAGATETPTVAAWTGKHPFHFFDLAPNVTHVMPAWIDQPEYFRQHYKYRTYQPEEIVPALCSALCDALQQPTVISGFYVSDKPAQDWIVIRDVYHDDCYKTALLKRRTSPEYVIDVGAHIGTFAKLWHERNPQAKIVCIEACPENIPVLQRNVGHFATVIHAACAYHTEPLYLLNAHGSDGKSTGGSRVVTQRELDTETDSQYWKDKRALPKVTLQEIMARHGFPQIDILKLDCEGSEYDILAHAPLDAIGFIVGEYHGKDKWDAFRQRILPGWDYGHMSEHGNFGNFHLRNSDRDIKRRIKDIEDWLEQGRQLLAEVKARC